MKKQNNSIILAFEKKASVSDIEALIKNGADVFERDSNGETPLHVAAKNGHAALIKLLLDAGSDVNDVDNVGFTPLICIASSSANESAMKMLLENGADVAVRDDSGMTAMHRLALNEDIPAEKLEQACALLIRHGADINTRDDVRETPLETMCACYLDDQMVKQRALILLSAGADPSIEGDEGNSLLKRVQAGNKVFKEICEQVMNSICK